MNIKINLFGHKQNSAAKTNKVSKPENLNDLAINSLLEPLSDNQATVISGGCPWIPSPYPGGPGHS